MALVNHKKLKIEDEDALEKEADKTADLAKKSLHDLSQVSFYQRKVTLTASLLSDILENYKKNRPAT